MVKKNFRDKVRATPEWIKFTLPFIIGLLASPTVQKLFDEWEQMDSILTGNITYANVVHYFDTTNAMLLYYLILVVILVGLFALLAWFWSKDSNTTSNDIQEIKKDVKTLLNEKRELSNKR